MLHKDFKKYLKTGKEPQKQLAIDQKQHYLSCTEFNCHTCTAARIIKLGLDKTNLSTEFQINLDALERSTALQQTIINKVESGDPPSMESYAEFRILYHGVLVSTTRYNQACKQIYELAHPIPKAPENEVQLLYNCPICYEHVPFKNLCAIQCGHVHCKSCTNQFMNNSEQICPICRADIVIVTPLLFTNL